MTPFATPDNWRRLGLRIHRWWMHSMRIKEGSQDEANFLIMGLTGELGELANFMKKEWRDGFNAQRREDIHKELADIQGYLVHLAEHYGVDLDQITAAKTNELIARWPEIWEDY